MNLIVNHIPENWEKDNPEAIKKWQKKIKIHCPSAPMNLTLNHKWIPNNRKY